MSDRIAVMNRGVIEQVEGPEEVYERPRHHLRGRLHRRVQPDARRGGDRRAATRAELRLDSGVTVSTESRGATAASAPTRSCAPRSSSCAGWSEPGAGDRPAVEGTVESSLYLGTATQFVVRPRGLHGDDRSGPERGRGGPAPAAGGGRPRSTGLGERAHPHRAGGGGPGRSADQRHEIAARGLIEGGRPCRESPRASSSAGSTLHHEDELTRRRAAAAGRRRRAQRERHRLSRRLRRRRAVGGGQGGDEGDRRRARSRAASPSRTGLSTSTSTTRPAATPRSTCSRRSTARRSSTSRRSTTTPSSSARSGRSTRGQLGRPRHPRGHRLDGGPDEAARLRPEVRQVGDAERRQEHRGRGGEPRLRPEARVLDAVAVGPGRPDLPEGPRRQEI